MIHVYMTVGCIVTILKQMVGETRHIPCEFMEREMHVMIPEHTLHETERYQSYSTSYTLTAVLTHPLSQTRHTVLLTNTLSKLLY